MCEVSISMNQSNILDMNELYLNVIRAVIKEFRLFIDCFLLSGHGKNHLTKQFIV